MNVSRPPASRHERMTTIKVKKAAGSRSPPHRRRRISSRAETSTRLSSSLHREGRAPPRAPAARPRGDRRPDLVGRHRPHGGPERFDPNRVGQVEPSRSSASAARCSTTCAPATRFSRHAPPLERAARRHAPPRGPARRTPDHGNRQAPRRGVEELYARQQKLSGSSVVGIDDAGPDLLEARVIRAPPIPSRPASRRELLGRLVGGSAICPRRCSRCCRSTMRQPQPQGARTVLGVTESRVWQTTERATRRSGTRWASWPWKQPLRSGGRSACRAKYI